MKYQLAILATALFLTTSTALAGDIYGPPPPPGFFAQATAKVVGFWNTLKQKLSAPVRPEVASGATAATLSVTATATATGTETSPPIAVNGIISPNTVSSVASIKLRTNVGRVDAAEPAPFTFRTKHEPPAPLPALANVIALKRHLKYDVSALPDKPVLPEKEFKIRTTLAQLKPMVLETVERISRDGLTLVLALIKWVNRPEQATDNALSELFNLSQKTGSALLREKALAFVAWILEDSKFDALASLVFTRAYAASPADAPSLSYDNALLAELSRMARSAIVTKTFLTIEKKLPHNTKLNTEAAGFLALLEAERAYDRNAFVASRKLAQAVPPKTQWKDQARYLAATSIMAEGDKRANTEEAGRELTQLFRTVEDPALFDLTAVTLGRIHFLLGNYKAAHNYLSQVSRDTNLFIEAAVDNAWALLRSGDRNHAVGNMFTLHTPYFEGAFMPESYFLQSLGYQEICQFGDAMTAIKQYKTHYSAVFQKLADFNSNGKKPDAQYYGDLAAYLAHHDHELPEIVLRELGRHPEFLKRQAALNQTARESRTMAGRFPSSGLALNKWMEATLATVHTQYDREMARFMKTRALSLEDELKFLTANISLLEYEIYAGAGNNLALQGAQNFAVDEKKAVPNHNFEDGKEYWPYEDEIWEDELNNFRSKMVDACAHVKPSS